MKKLCRTLACPNCGSTNVKASKILEKVKNIHVPGAFNKEVYSKAYSCFCNKCSNEYLVDYGKETYTTYETPEDMTVCGDVKKIIEFEGESERNFNIFVASDSNCDPIYYALLDDDIFPVFITKEQVEAFSKDVSLAKSFFYNTWMNRYR